MVATIRWSVDAVREEVVVLTEDSSTVLNLGAPLICLGVSVVSVSCAETPAGVDSLGEVADGIQRHLMKQVCLKK